MCIKQEAAVTAAGNFGLWRCCFFVVFMRFSWGAWEVLPGTVTFLMWEYDRGMVKVGKTGGTGWTGEKEGDRLKIKPAGASYYKSAGGRGRRTAPGKVSGNSARESFRGHFQGKFQRRAPGKVPEGSSREGSERSAREALGKFQGKVLRETLGISCVGSYAFRKR